jgi:hypothetical protein
MPSCLEQVAGVLQEEPERFEMTDIELVAKPEGYMKVAFALKDTQKEFPDIDGHISIINLKVSQPGVIMNAKFNKFQAECVAVFSDWHRRFTFARNFQHVPPKVIYIEDPNKPRQVHRVLVFLHASGLLTSKIRALEAKSRGFYHLDKSATVTPNFALHLSLDALRMPSSECAVMPPHSGV